MKIIVIAIILDEDIGLAITYIFLLMIEKCIIGW